MSEPSSERMSLVLRLLAIAAWMGLGYGIIEGTESFVLSQIPNALSWRNANSVQALMVMPLLYLVAYLGVALLFVPIAVLIRRDWVDQVLMFLLGALSGYLAAKTTGVIVQWTCVILGLGVGTVSVRLYRKHRAQWSAGVIRRFPLMAGFALVLIGVTFLTTRLLESRRLTALPAPAAGRPNVLLIVLDTQRADFLSGYGHHRLTTPRLDSLAAEGAVFERAYASSSWTLPTHASLFTGLLGFQHGAEAEVRRIFRPGPQTVAEMLAGQGYATGGFVANTYWTGRHTGLARGFARYEDYYGTLGDALGRATLIRDFGTVQELLGAIDVRGRKRAHHVNREFLGWLERIDDRPFFAFLNYFDVHAPYLPPKPFAGRFGSLRQDLTPTRLEIGNEVKVRQSQEQMRYKMDRYQEAMLYLDTHLGDLFGELRRRGVLDNTVVIITSDHGEHFGEHGINGHGVSLYTPEIWVPLIIRYPRSIPAGIRMRAPVSIANVPATITALAGIEGTFPGRSLLLPDSAPGPEAVPVLSEMAESAGNEPEDWPGSKGWVKSLVAGPWHYIRLEDGDEELFNLGTEPHDGTNLTAAAEHAALLMELRTRMNAILGQGAWTGAGRRTTSAAPVARRN
jgi:arylsulfatase A-like enzyme